MEIIFGLGIYCIGGFVVSAILAAAIADAIIWQQRKEEQLAKEAQGRLLAWEKDEEQAMAFARRRLRNLHAGVATEADVGGDV